MSEIESKVKAIIVDKLGGLSPRQVSQMILVLTLSIPLSSSWSLRRSSVSLSPTIRLRKSVL